MTKGVGVGVVRFDHSYLLTVALHLLAQVHCPARHVIRSSRSQGNGPLFSRRWVLVLDFLAACPSQATRPQPADCSDLEGAKVEVVLVLTISDAHIPNNTCRLPTQASLDFES